MNPFRDMQYVLEAMAAEGYPEPTPPAPQPLPPEPDPFPNQPKIQPANAGPTPAEEGCIILRAMVKELVPKEEHHRVVVIPGIAASMGHVFTWEISYAWDDGHHHVGSVTAPSTYARLRMWREVIPDFWLQLGDIFRNRLKE